MTPLVRLQERLFAPLDRHAAVILPTAARAVFAAVLFVYFWASGLTKLGDGIAGFWTPALGAYAQIFPRALEAAGYDVSQLGLWHRLVVLAGTWAEFILPVLFVLGLFTRIAALGLIGFVLVQSATDILGHGAAGATLGAWFDRDSAALILDQRALWILLLAIPLTLGGGALSIDRLLDRAATRAG
jgi:putative oxidoreductase